MGRVKVYITIEGTTGSLVKEYRLKTPYFYKQTLTLTSSTPEPRGVYCTIQDWGDMLLIYYVHVQRSEKEYKFPKEKFVVKCNFDKQ